MDWINLHTSFLDSPEFLGAEPVDRATWLCLMRYCVGQENGGTIVAAAEWGDRKWQQLVRVTLKEVNRTSDLWKWVDNDLVVSAYPIEKQVEIQFLRAIGKTSTPAKAAAAKANGSLGGRPRKNQTENPTCLVFETEQKTPLEPIEGNGRGIGIGRECERETHASDLEHDIGSSSAGIQPAADADRWGYIRIESWAKLLVAAGCKIGPQNWPAWKALGDRYSHDRVLEVARTCPATDRWPDRTETALAKIGGQAPISQSINHRIKSLT